MEMKEIIKKFYNETGYVLEEREGGLYYGGSLYLFGSRITSLPDNLKVCGWLCLIGTGITSLPDNLEVGGWLDVRETCITSIPGNLKVGGRIFF